MLFRIILIKIKIVYSLLIILTIIGVLIGLTFIIISATSNNGANTDNGKETNTGFENWNRGFNEWKAWGNILYTEDSIYNVHDARLTLQEYQSAMNLSLMQMDILMGALRNIVICGEWKAIHYDTTNIKNGEETLSRVEFKITNLN